MIIHQLEICNRQLRELSSATNVKKNLGLSRQCHNGNLKSHKYASITTYQPNTKSDPNPNPNPKPTTKQHAVVNIQLNVVACRTYPGKFIQHGHVVAPSVLL